MDLRGANLISANLISANLSGADLSGANLSDADLPHDDLSDANLTGADLSGRPPRFARSGCCEPNPQAVSALRVSACTLLFCLGTYTILET